MIGLPRHRPPRRLPHGFTIVELMITLAVLSVLVSLAFPSLSSFLANQRVKTAAQDVLMSMMYARSEAIKRNVNVYVKSNGGNWQNGWAVMIADQTFASCTDGNADDANCIKIYDAKNGVSISEENSLASFNYNRAGRSSANVNLSVCDHPAKTTTTKRIININLSGRPNIKQSGGCS